MEKITEELLLKHGFRKEPYHVSEHSFCGVFFFREFEDGKSKVGLKEWYYGWRICVWKKHTHIGEDDNTINILVETIEDIKKALDLAKIQNDDF